MAKKLRSMDLQIFADGGAPTPPKGGGFSAEYVQELRTENAGWRTKLRATEDELSKVKTKLEAATAAEGETKVFLEGISKVLGLDASTMALKDVIPKFTEIASKDNPVTEKARVALQKTAFITAAINKGVRKEVLEDAYKLADFSNVKVDLDTISVFPVDKDGNQLKDNNDKPILGLDSLVETMVKEKSWLLGKSNASVGSPSNPGGAPQTKDPEGFGAQLGKKQREQAKRQTDVQGHYFPG